MASVNSVLTVKQDASASESLSMDNTHYNGFYSCCNDNSEDHFDAGPLAGMSVGKLGSLEMLSEITMTVSQLSLDELEPSGMEKLNQDGHLDNAPQLPRLHRSSIISIPESLADSTCGSSSSRTSDIHHQQQENQESKSKNAPADNAHEETAKKLHQHCHQQQPQQPMSYLALQREALRSLFESDCTADTPPRIALRNPSVDDTGDAFSSDDLSS